MNRRPVLFGGALAAAAVTGAVATIAVAGGAAAPAAPPLRAGTAAVVRTNLATSVLTAGTLGYAPARPLTNQRAGIYTRLPMTGATIRPGQVLYWVNNQPVVGMRGRTPAWRTFSAGMTPGPDVRELQANLIVLGYANGLFGTPSGSYDTATIDAVERWQAAAGYLVTGQIALGEVVFEPSAVKVGAMNVADGQQAQPGQAPYQVTTALRTVTVPWNPNLPQVQVGERVQIVLPTGARTPGRITAIGPQAGNGNGGSGGSGGTGGTGSGSTPGTVLTVRPDRPRAARGGAEVPVQVALTVQSVRQVLAVPVSALLALAGGGYGLEVVLPSGAHRLIGIRTGIFASGMVQVSGPDLAPGTKVVVAS